MRDFYAIRGVNPEPWTAPEVGVGRSGGRLVPRVFKSEALAVYQQAVAAHLREHYPEVEPVEGPVELVFAFRRQLVGYQGERRRYRKNAADATNMQKALEDALQGVLIGNDRNSRHIESWVIDQAADVEPLILIGVAPYSGLHPDLDAVVAELDKWAPTNNREPDIDFDPEVYF